MLHELGKIPRLPNSVTKIYRCLMVFGIWIKRLWKLNQNVPSMPTIFGILDHYGVRS